VRVKGARGAGASTRGRRCAAEEALNPTERQAHSSPPHDPPKQNAHSPAAPPAAQSGFRVSVSRFFPLGILFCIGPLIGSRSRKESEKEKNKNKYLGDICLFN